jgi:hypothetical protein
MITDEKNLRGLFFYWDLGFATQNTSFEGKETEVRTSPSPGRGYHEFDHPPPENLTV